MTTTRSNTASRTSLRTSDFPAVSASSAASDMSVNNVNNGNTEAKDSGPNASTCAINSNKLSRKGSNGGCKTSRANSKKSVYKHVPHALKPVHLVAKRNARERRRVQAVNSAFIRLRKHVPYEPRHKRLSKVKTLRVAITYISHLQDLIREHDRRMAARANHSHNHRLHNHHHHHHPHHNSHSLDILADAAASTSTSTVGISSDDGAGGVVHFDNDFHFLNAPGGSGGGAGGGGEAGLGVSSRSSYLHQTSHAPSHLYGRPVNMAGPGVEQLHSSWVDGLHHTNPSDEGVKVSAFSPDSALYFVSSPCQPPPFDGNPAAYMPYDACNSIQSPYQLMR